MQLKNRTILITGGTSGIGLELARRLLDLGNTVVVTGRDREKLDATSRALPGVHAIRSDVGDPQDIEALHATIASKFPALDVLVNNAGVMRKLDLRNPALSGDDAVREIGINLAGPVRMVQRFLPLLLTRTEAAIVNVSSGLAFVPLAISPVYSATKAALHSYTQSLRLQLGGTNVAVFELAPPGTETALFSNDFTADDLKGAKPMSVEALVDHAIVALGKDRSEIRPGLSNVLHWAGRIAPRFVGRQLGRGADRMGR